MEIHLTEATADVCVCVCVCMYVCMYVYVYVCKIKAAIKDPSSVDKNLHSFVKKSGFQILNIPRLGARDVLVVPAKQQVGLTVMLVVGNCRCMYSHAFHRTICISCSI